MPRDQKLKRAFEVADDGIQGAFGYFLFGLACRKASNVEDLIAFLPRESIPITHDWVRFYSPNDLHRTMTECFDAYHARVSLVSMICFFEAALQEFRSHLASLKKIPSPDKRENYKTRLKWAFQEVQTTPPKNTAMAARVPDVCLAVDHARRIRNLWMHNNDVFNQHYKDDAIQVLERNPIIDREYAKFAKRRNQKIPFFLSPDQFYEAYLSHVELLHELNDAIQRKYFGQIRSYNYRMERKQIEWHRLLLGV